MELQYKGRRGGNISDQDAAIIGPYLQAMADKMGTLQPEDVVEDARDPNSPLHDYFEWDTEKAAIELWKREARQIINSIIIVQKQNGNMVERRLFLNLSIDPEEEGEGGGLAYIPISVVLGTPDLREKLWDKAMRELESWARRWGAYAEFVHISTQIKLLIAENSDIADLAAS